MIDYFFCFTSPNVGMGLPSWGTLSPGLSAGGLGAGGFTDGGPYVGDGLNVTGGP